MGLVSRKWLVQLAADGRLLDETTRELMLVVIDRCQSTSPCGTLYDLACSLGAPHENAALAASLSELFYAVC